MSGASLLAEGESRFVVAGALDFSTVAPLVAEGERLFTGTGRLEVDLRGVSSANSAGLALLLEWLHLARRRKLSLRFHHLPESLMRLAALTNLTAVLPLVHGDA